MISLVYNRRAIPIYFTLLGKLGNTNTIEQKWFLAIVLELLQDYPKVVLGDRPFTVSVLACLSPLQDIMRLKLIQVSTELLIQQFPSTFVGKLESVIVVLVLVGQSS